MNVKGLLSKMTTGLLLLMGSVPVTAAPPLITSVTQIAVPVRNEIVSTSYVGSSVTALQNGLAAETAARVNADIALNSVISSHTVKLVQVAIDTTSLKGQIDAVAASTGVTQIVAGTNVSISPLDGKGAVTISASGGIGDVVATGNNVFTGLNAFNNKATFNAQTSYNVNIVWNGIGVDSLGTLDTSGINQTGVITLDIFPPAGSTDGQSSVTGYLVDVCQGGLALGYGLNKNADGCTYTGGEQYTITITGGPLPALAVIDGNEAVGKVLTSDASGNASWQTLATGGDAYLASTQTFTGENTFTRPLVVDSTLDVNGSIKMVDGNQQAGYVMTSDANGLASWQAASGGTPAILDSTFTTTDDAFSVRTWNSNGYPTIEWKAPSGKLVLGCNASNGECGSQNVDSEGIAVSYPTGNAVGRLKGDKIYLSPATDTGTNFRFFLVDSTRFRLKNKGNGTSDSVTDDVFRVTLASSNTWVNGSLTYVDGNQAAGKVLTSDASGNATWQTAGGGGDTYLASTQTFTGENTFERPVSIMSATGGNLKLYATNGVNGIVQVMNDGETGKVALYDSLDSDSVVLYASNGSGEFTGYVQASRGEIKATPFQQLRFRDPADSGEQANLNIYGVAGDADFIAANTYFNGSEWVAAKPGGASLIKMDTNSSGDTNGRVTIYASTTVAQDAPITPNEMLTIIPNGTDGTRQVKFGGQVNVEGTTYPQIKAQDTYGGKGIASLGGTTGFASVVAGNLYYDGADWKRSTAGGGFYLFGDISGNATAGDFAIGVTTSGPADVALVGGELRDFFRYTAQNQRVGIMSNGAPDRTLDVGGDTQIDGTLFVGFHQVTNTCNASTSCTATCSPGEAAMGGSCDGNQAAPVDSNLGSDSYSCLVGVSTSIIVKAACARFGN